MFTYIKSLRMKKIYLCGKKEYERMGLDLGLLVNDSLRICFIDCVYYFDICHTFFLIYFLNIFIRLLALSLYKA